MRLWRKKKNKKTRMGQGCAVARGGERKDTGIGHGNEWEDYKVICNEKVIWIKGQEILLLDGE